MKLETITRIQSTRVDFSAPGAAMQLAWKRAADDAWLYHRFDGPPAPDFATLLKEAHRDVARRREYRRKEALAAKDPDIQLLREQRELLANKPWGVNIASARRRIDAEIARRKELME